MKIGTGWDIHPLVPGRPLLIGGVEIPHDRGEAGHSDGDVLIHAVIDALLGASAKGDIGTLYPPTDPRWKDAPSLLLLENTLAVLAWYRIENIDCTVILERPKLLPHIPSIRVSLSEACGIPLDCVSVKAKTAEGMLGQVGSGEAVIAQAVVLLSERTEEELPMAPWL